VCQWRYILQQKCLKKWTLNTRTHSRIYGYARTDPEHITMHSVTDTVTADIGRHYDANSRSYCSKMITELNRTGQYRINAVDWADLSHWAENSSLKCGNVDICLLTCCVDERHWLVVADDSSLLNDTVLVWMLMMEIVVRRWVFVVFIDYNLQLCWQPYYGQ